MTSKIAEGGIRNEGQLTQPISYSRLPIPLSLWTRAAIDVAIASAALAAIGAAAWRFVGPMPDPFSPPPSGWAARLVVGGLPGAIGFCQANVMALVACAAGAAACSSTLKSGRRGSTAVALAACLIAACSVAVAWLA